MNAFPWIIHVVLVHEALFIGVNGLQEHFHVLFFLLLNNFLEVVIRSVVASYIFGEHLHDFGGGRSLRHFCYAQSAQKGPTLFGLLPFNLFVAFQILLEAHLVVAVKVHDLLDS